MFIVFRFIFFLAFLFLFFALHAFHKFLFLDGITQGFHHVDYVHVFV